MSTQSLIGIEIGDEVKYIYCHYDGYPDGVGAELRKNFVTIKDIKALIDGGDCSTIISEVTSYASRGESWEEVKPRTIKRSEYNIEYGKEYGVDYMYLFTENKGWEIRCCYGYGSQTDFEDE